MKTCSACGHAHHAPCQACPGEAPTLRDLLAIEIIERRLAAGPPAFVSLLAREAYQIADAMMEASSNDR